MTRRSLIRRIAAASAVNRLAALPRPSAPTPFGAHPSQAQLRWHALEFYGFLHFTVNTFTDREWGEGDEDPSIFNPSGFDPDSIILALKSSGMKGVILTCKHHDGFCLWPTATTDHSVRRSTWRGGKGDVVKDISEAARRHGLKFGVYLSPWDRNSALYGSPEYIPFYRRQLTELLTNYGPIFEIWHDGANGGTGYYGGAREKRTIDKHSYYDWPRTWSLARSLQPDAVIFSDVGPDIRWVGNEKGIAGDPCWDTFTPVGANGGPAAPGDVNESENNSGTRNGKMWMPPECDVSIRPGWFWHQKENGQVKTPSQLFDLYCKSVGRGGSFLLNVPPTSEGRLHENDVAALTGFRQLVQSAFGKNLAIRAQVTASNTRGGDTTRFGPMHLLSENPSSYWATDDHLRTAEVIFEFPEPLSFNLLRIREAIELGQRVGAMAIEHWNSGGWRPAAKVTSIGACRLVRLAPDIVTTKVRLRVTESLAAPALREVGFFAEAK